MTPRLLTAVPAAVSAPPPSARSCSSWSSTRWWLLTAALVVTTSCGNLPPAGPASLAAVKGSERVDDSNPAALVPAGGETVIDVDMSALRRSAWTAPLIAARDQKTQAAQTEALGYDDVSDVDRIIYVVTAAGPDGPTLVIAQGRFQATRLDDAFRSRWPGAVADGWRGIAVVSSGENAFASLTPRTFVSGPPPAVRTVIDRAFGVGLDLEADPNLGPVSRALRPEGRGGHPAVTGIVVVNQRMRARARDVMELPPDLHQVGLRMDLGRSLDVLALGFLDDRDAALALAHRLDALLGGPMAQLGLRALGLGSLLAGTRVTSDGARVIVRATVPDEQRADLTATLQALLQSARGEGGGALKLRSW